ncbi:hypothetical protein [Curtobacterium sp. MCBA15_004]|uniref:hypothetical protein n=1 Tax=unclassified Curtobacterium TaxID=257496 RepID=UPI001587DA34|nr:hypothetical protein [Curtobacterium sp. MCBA15_004]WIA97977.1 hypothetical protein QOL16_06205 [Curtobacterium sp. MCBA15_004]
MSKYETDQHVQQVHVTTYRHLRRAARRGWELAEPVAAPSLADLVGTPVPRRPEHR